MGLYCFASDRVCLYVLFLRVYFCLCTLRACVCKAADAWNILIYAYVCVCVSGVVLLCVCVLGHFYVCMCSYVFVSTYLFVSVHTG